MVLLIEMMPRFVLLGLRFRAFSVSTFYVPQIIITYKKIINSPFCPVPGVVFYTMLLERLWSNADSCVVAVEDNKL